MKPLKYLLLPCLAVILATAFLVLPVTAGDLGGYEVKGSVTVDNQYYDRNKDTSTSGFLSRYQHYPSEDNYNRINIPYLDLTLQKNDGHTTFQLQRFAPWLKNDRILLNADPTGGVELELDYMRYRKNMEGLAPTTTGTPGLHYTAVFNNDAATDEFFVQRSKTDLALMLTPEAWGGSEGGFLDSVKLWVNNEDKEGQKHYSYILSSSDVAAGAISSRWRGRDEPFDSRVINLGTELTFNPLAENDFSAFLGYEREDFESEDLYTVADVAAMDANVVGSSKSIDYIADSRKEAASLELVDTISDSIICRYGVRYANLFQESYNSAQEAASYDGLIKNTTITASASYTGIKNTDLTGFYHYNHRENSSEVGLSGYKDLNSNVSDPHVADIRSQKYGADASYRLDRLNSVIRVSGRKDMVEREFQRPVGSNAIPFFSSPYTIDTDRWIYSASLYSRFLKDLLVTASFSYEDADDTAMPLESEKTMNGQVMATYSMMDGRAAISASYRGEEKENDNFKWFGTGATNADKDASNSVNQDWESTQSSWGVDAWWQVTDTINLFGAYMVDTLEEESNWLLSQFRRWQALNQFVNQEEGLGYESENQTFSLGTNIQFTPKAGLLISYMLSDSTGEIMSGTTALDNIIEIGNQYQNLNLELNLLASDRSDITLGYLYEDYEDDVEEGHDGRNQTVSVAYRLKF